MKELINLNGNLHEVNDGIASAAATQLPPGSTCNGNACGVISVTWTGHGYRVQNNSPKRVRVRIRFTFGLQCMDWSSMDLNPGQFRDWGNGAYCNPIEANYI